MEKNAYTLMTTTTMFHCTCSASIAILRSKIIFILRTIYRRRYQLHPHATLPSLFMNVVAWLCASRIYAYYVYTHFARTSKTQQIRASHFFIRIFFPIPLKVIQQIYVFLAACVSRFYTHTHTYTR